MKKIGIVIAMEEEFQAIENKIKEIKVHEEKGLKFFEGKIGEKECVIVKSGEWNNHLHMSCLLVVQMNGEGMASRA